MYKPDVVESIGQQPLTLCLGLEIPGGGKIAVKGNIPATGTLQDIRAPGMADIFIKTPQLLPTGTFLLKCLFEIANDLTDKETEN